MAYSDFDQATLEQSFQLQFGQTQGILTPTPVPISDYLKQTLARNGPLATAINTEKARSELLIAPILVELKTHYPQVSLFSGIEFNVDPQLGLKGRCDFLISQHPDQITLKAPVAVIVEAKREDLNAAVPQCVAAMVAAQLFNRKLKNTDASGDVNQTMGQGTVTSIHGPIYGCVTTGSVWRFLTLDDHHVTIDLNEIYLAPIDTLMGYLSAMVVLPTPSP